MNLFNFKKQAGRIIIKIFGIKISFKQKKNKQVLHKFLTVTSPLF